MVPAFSYEIIQRELERKFREQFNNHFERGTLGHAIAKAWRPSTLPDRVDTRVKMVGLLFARPTSPLAKSEIIPQLDYFHHRSGQHIDFFCSGFGQYWGDRPEFSDKQKMPPQKGTDSTWFFSPEKFNSFRSEIESMTNWRYSGASDLLLSNARFNLRTRQAYIDFSSSICCQLDQMVEDGAIRSVEKFFEDVCRFAENAAGNDPTWGFSDHKGIDVAGSAIKRIILDLIPKKLGADVKRIEHFAIRDVSRLAR